MKKNAIHNFDISIQNSADIQSSEQLAQTIIKELAKVSKEINQQQDIEQLWQEQKDQNASTTISSNTTSSDSKKSIWSSHDTSISKAPNGGGAADNIDRENSSSGASEGITPSLMRANESLQNLSSTRQVYGLHWQQKLTIPNRYQNTTNDPSVEVIKAEIKNKLYEAIQAEDNVGVKYWTRLSIAFDKGAVAADFDGKSEEFLFTQVYADLKKSMLSSVEIRNFNWESVRKKMTEAIDLNILKGSISPINKERWENIKKLLLNENTNLANLFEQYDELFLLLKEVEGLESLPNTLTIKTKTKIYPNLSADKIYANIGKEDIYVFLKQISETNLRGSAVDKGAVKIRNAKQTSFIVGESLEFFVDETFIKQELNSKDNINWVVYNSDTQKKDVFKNEGVSFNYNFDAPGNYRVDAYGFKDTIKQKKNAKVATFIELNIVNQEITITSSGVNKEGFARASTKEKLFKVALKNSKVKTLNPLKLYYQIETSVNDKAAVISEERELDATGIIKLAMPDFGTYKIKVSSKDQYGLVKEFKTSVIKNEVTSIGYVNGSPNRNVFLVGNSGSSLTLEPKTYKINPPTEKEKQDVKWMIYDSNNKTYIQSGEAVTYENDDPKKPFILKWESFLVPIPQKEGYYTVEAYYDIKKGPKDGVVFKMEVKKPEIAEAYWASKTGSKKITSGFLGESNWIKANMPYYENQLVRVYFYLKNKKTDYYIDVKTNENGDIFHEVKFDSNFKKLIGFTNDRNAKIGFKLLGIQNGKPYAFRKPLNHESDTVLLVTTDKKVVDVYFRHDGNRVRFEDEVPFHKKGEMVTVVAKTQNMIGDQVTLKVHQVGEKPIFTNKVIVNSEGVAAASFLFRNFDEKLKIGTKINYYAGVEEYSTRHLKDKVLIMIVGDGKKKKIFNLTWGSKVSEDFREKVIEICTDLWPENTIEMANGLMAVMYRETNKTFAANQLEGYKSLIPRSDMTTKNFEKINKKTGQMGSRAVGLIQFTQNALVSMDEFKNGDGFEKLHKLKLAYANMTDVAQLEKVKKYFKSVARLPRVPDDIYVAVFSPGFVGKANTETLYKKGTNDYNSNSSLDKNNNGIQKSELLAKYYESLKEGNNGNNIAKVGIQTNKKETNKKEIVSSKFDNVNLHFTGATATESSLSNKTKNILKEVGAKTKNFDIYITSTARNTYDQARIMYENCSKVGGVRKQKGIYADPGDKVIDVYVAGIKAGNSKKEIITSMENKIKQLGPSTVSKHIADFDVMNTFDVPYGLLANKNDFLKEIEKRKELDKVLVENNCYHIQINQ